MKAILFWSAAAVSCEASAAARTCVEFDKLVKLRGMPTLIHWEDDTNMVEGRDWTVTHDVVHHGRVGADGRTHIDKIADKFEQKLPTDEEILSEFAEVFEAKMNRGEAEDDLHLVCKGSPPTAGDARIYGLTYRGKPITLSFNITP